MNPEQPNNPQAPIGPTPPQQPAVPEAPQQPAVPQPQPEVAAPAPVVPEAPAPALDAAPAPVAAPQPVTPEPAQPVAAQPFAPTPGTVPPQPPVAGPAAFGTGPALAPVPAKNNKLIALIAGIVGGIVVIGLVVWVLIAFVFNSISLETYKGDDFTVLVPKDYEKEEAGDTISWKSEAHEAENGEDVYSGVTVSAVDMPASMSVKTIVESYDEMFTEEAFVKAAESEVGSGSSVKIKDFKINKDDYQGITARTFTATVHTDDKKTGDLYMRVVFTDDRMYMIMVAAHSQIEPGFRKAAEKIFNSLEIEE